DRRCGRQSDQMRWFHKSGNGLTRKLQLPQSGLRGERGPAQNRTMKFAFSVSDGSSPPSGKFPQVSRTKNLHTGTSTPAEYSQLESPCWMASARRVKRSRVSLPDAIEIVLSIPTNG